MYWEEFREEEFNVAIDKFGSLCAFQLTGMEKHGQHLPVGTDDMIAKAIIAEALKIEDTVIFPSGSWIGDISGHFTKKADGKPKFYGSIELSTELQYTILKEICNEIRRCGFKKVLIICKQPATTFLAHFFSFCIEYYPRDFAIMVTDAVNRDKSTPEAVLKAVTERPLDFPEITEEDKKTLKRWADEKVHDVEYADTCLMMAIRENLVATDRFNVEKDEAAFDLAPFEAEGIKMAGMTEMKHSNGIYSKVAEGCTKSIGKALLKINAEHMAEIFKLIKNDEECIRISKAIPMETK